MTIFVLWSFFDKKVKISQETYDKMTRPAKINHKTLEDYIQLDSSIIKY